MHQLHDSSIGKKDNKNEPQSRYRIPISAFAVLIGVTLLFGVLYLTLPARITLGVNWLPLAVILITLLPLIITRIFQHPISYHYTRAMMLIMLGFITVALIAGVILLIMTLPQRQQGQSVSLLRTGASLWVGNILVFALWYWELDGGGPKVRHENGNKAADFLFPQQADGNKSGWVPHLIDYLFLGFTGATALSPADTYPLTRRAKCLMMLEAILALIVLTILIGRAVNIL